jgi:hypothetical protein
MVSFISNIIYVFTGMLVPTNQSIQFACGYTSFGLHTLASEFSPSAFIITYSIIYVVVGGLSHVVQCTYAGTMYASIPLAILHLDVHHDSIASLSCVSSVYCKVHCTACNIYILLCELSTLCVSCFTYPLESMHLTLHCALCVPLHSLQCLFSCRIPTLFMICSQTDPLYTCFCCMI